MKSKLKFFTIILLLFTSFSIQAQNYCGTELIIDSLIGEDSGSVASVENLVK